MKKGFTLVELLIVMVVVTILATLAVPKYKIAMERGRGLEGLHNAQAISDALNAFYIQDGNVYHAARHTLALNASGATNGKYFDCTIAANTEEVTCERNNSSYPYKIVFSNSEGATTGKSCVENSGKYCRALGATLPGNSGEWSFPQ